MSSNSSSAYDAVVIGAGPGGIYTTLQLEKMFPKKRMVVLEKCNNVGGRLFSYESWNESEDTVKDELGGMRIFPSVHKEVFGLVQEANLETIGIPLNDKDSLFNNEGKVKRKKEVVYTDPNGAFFGEGIGEISRIAKKNFEAEFGVQKDAYECEALQNLSLREYFKKYGGANDNEVDFWFKYSGYDLYDEKVQVAIYIADGELYGSALTHHHFVKNGYAAVVQYMKHQLRSEVKFNVKVTRVEKLPNGTFKVMCADGKCFTCKDLICSLTKMQLENIHGIKKIISDRRWQSIQASKTKPLFKAFLHWDNPWWHAFRNQGKTTTSGPCRQIHYYDEHDMLIYNSGEFAIEWGEIFKTNAMAGYRKMFEEIKKIHEPIIGKIQEPNWEKCVHKFWPDGSHKWIKGVNARKCIQMVTDGSRDGIWITGDAWSDAQGWVQGALDTSKILLKKFAKATKNEKQSYSSHAATELETAPFLRKETIKKEPASMEVETRCFCCICVR